MMEFWAKSPDFMLNHDGIHRCFMLYLWDLGSWFTPLRFWNPWDVPFSCISIFLHVFHWFSVVLLHGFSMFSWFSTGLPHVFHRVFHAVLPWIHGAFEAWPLSTPLQPLRRSGGSRGGSGGARCAVERVVTGLLIVIGWWFSTFDLFLYNYWEQ